jgi:DNA polymerase bacteriophage-type
MALNDEDPVVWYPGAEIDEKYWDALEDPSVLIYAFHAAFEMAILQALCWKTWGIKCPDLKRFRCVQSLARRAALPAKLETLGEALDLPFKKDNRGKALIKKFSVLQPAKKPSKKNAQGLPPRRIYPKDEPEAFAEFCNYCAQDVRTEQSACSRLAYFDCEPNTSNYSLDAIINARGVTVNLDALRHAQKLIEEETEIVSAKFRALCGFDPTQRDVFLRWLHEKGCHLDDLQADTIEEFLGKKDVEKTFPLVAIESLHLKHSVAYASIKKVQTMIECAGPADNRLRGMMNHHGASTGRWTHSLVQPGNFKRPTIKHSEEAYREICQGISREMLDLCYGPPLEVISSCVRHFFQDGSNNIFDGDYAGIEARVVNWLAGQEDALERFREYDRAPAGSDLKKSLDPYRIMAAQVYGIPVTEVQQFPHRFVGKGLILGAGFMLSANGYRRQCLEQAGYDLPEGQEHHAIGLWRKKHPKVVKWWKELDMAGKSALLHREKVFSAGKVKFFSKQVEGLNFLFMQLPSGRKLAYPRPRIVPGKFEGTTQIEYWGNIKGQTWGWCRLWPGVMANNSTQGTANDVMFVGAHNCERDGYQIFNVIHDQALAYIRPGQTSERFTELLTKMPDWAKGLPLASEGGEAPFYRKS